MPREEAIKTLVSIGQIKTLQHLHLAVEDYATCCVTHYDLRRHLRGLEQLKLLAISGETENLSYFSRLDTEFADIEIKQHAMFGSLRSMIDLRARPDLDDHLFDAEVLTLGVWYPDQDSEYGCPAYGIGPVHDRYGYLSVDVCTGLVSRNSKLAEAEVYAHVFPRLSRIFFGEILIEVMLPGSKKPGNVRPLTNKRMSEFPCKTAFEMTEPEKFLPSQEDA